MWQNFIGHKTQVALLKKAVREEKIPNGYLFTGHRGVGKFLAAKNFVKEALCTHLVDQNHKIKLCNKIDADNHPDIHIVLADGENIKIEQVRNLTAKLQLHALESEHKFVIINEAERMTAAASNALLKVLEEPPASTHFVLTSSSAHRLLATIRSRCQSIAFAPLPESEISKYLLSNHGLDKATAKRIAKMSQGNLELACQIEPSFISEVLDRFRALSLKGSAADIMALSEEWSRAEQTRLIVDLLASWYRDQLCALQTQDSSKLIHTQAFPTNHSLLRLEQDISLLLSTRQALESTANKQLLFERLLFSLTG